jgi:hypothetical protein
MSVHEPGHAPRTTAMHGYWVGRHEQVQNLPVRVHI